MDVVESGAVESGVVESGAVESGAVGTDSLSSPVLSGNHYLCSLVEGSMNLMEMKRVVSLNPVFRMVVRAAAVFVAIICVTACCRNRSGDAAGSLAGSGSAGALKCCGCSGDACGRRTGVQGCSGDACGRRTGVQGCSGDACGRRTGQYGLVSGDLVFVKLVDGADTIFVHTAAVEVDSAGTWIVDATIKRGVARYPVDTFITSFRRHDGSFPAFEVMRLKDTSGVCGFLKKAESFIGEPYNCLFERGNGSHYCTELIYDSYVRDGEHLFRMTTLDFRNGEGQIPSYWTRTFGRIDAEVPQGKTGILPLDMMKSEYLFLVEVISVPPQWPESSLTVQKAVGRR